MERQSIMILRNILVLAALIATVNASYAGEQSIVLAATRSVEASGLLAAIIPQFTLRTGIVVGVIAQSSGDALNIARRGDADLVLVHDADAEQKFMDEGYGVTRRQVAWSDFIMVGSRTDPAHIRGGSDFVSALKAIARVKAPFISRGDGSSTSMAELRL
jgi:tungstate transport system substrate-binding protein